MQMNEESLLAVTNPYELLAAGAVFLAFAWLCARSSRNTNDFAKSVRRYIPCVVVLDILVFFLFHIDPLLVVGLDICGFVALALFSNYYFYH